MYMRSTEIANLSLSKINTAGRIFELIGIYDEYSCWSNIDHVSFDNYYKVKRSTTKYHYRNEGEKIIKNRLLARGIEISRYDFRVMSQTWKYFPIITPISMDIIIIEQMKYLKASSLLWSVFSTLILSECDSATKNLSRDEMRVVSCLHKLIDFQLDMLNDRTNGSVLSKKQLAFKKCKENCLACPELVDIYKACGAHNKLST